MKDHWIFIRWLSFLILIVSTVQNSVLADTLILHSNKSSGSKSIAKIVDSIRIYAPESDVFKTDTLDINLSSIEEKYDSIIVLGDDLAKQSFTKPLLIPHVFGGFTGKADLSSSENSLTLEIRPSVLYDEIRKVGIPLKAVWTVVTPDHNPELLAAASLDAESQGIDLKVITAGGKQSAARAWFDLLNTLDPETDVVWILDPTYLDESGAYKYLLETSWKRSIPIVSHFPRYARRAVAIGFLPDLKLYSKRLVSLLSELDDGSGYRRYLTTDELQRVLNKRTLEHLGLRLPDDLDALSMEDIVIR